MSQLRFAWTWLKWPVALVILGCLVWMNRDGVAELGQRQLHWGYLAAAIACCAAATLSAILRWYLLVAALGFTFRLRDAVRLGLMGQLLSYVGPGIVGGDLLKALFLIRGQASRRTVAVATVLLDRIVGLLSLFILGALMTLVVRGLPASPEIRIVTCLLWLGSISGILGLTVALIPGSTRWWLVRQLPRLPLVGRTCGELMQGVVLYQARPQVIVSSVLIGMASRTVAIIGFYCAGRAIEPWVLDLAKHFYFMPMAELFATLLPTPGGIGGLEGAVQYSYQSLAEGVVPPLAAQHAGFVAALIFRLVAVGVAGLGMCCSILVQEVETSVLAEVPATPRATVPLPSASVRKGLRSRVCDAPK